MVDDQEEVWRTLARQGDQKEGKPTGKGEGGRQHAFPPCAPSINLAIITTLSTACSV